MKRILLLLAALGLCGCTHVSLEPKTGRVDYWQCLQDKTVQVQTPEGLTVTYSSNNTPVIVLGEKVGALVKGAAK